MNYKISTWEFRKSQSDSRLLRLPCRGHYDPFVSHGPRFGKFGLLVTICDSQFFAKQKANYCVRIDTTIMRSQVCSY